MSDESGNLGDESAILGAEPATLGAQPGGTQKYVGTSTDFGTKLVAKSCGTPSVAGDTPGRTSGDTEGHFGTRKFSTGHSVGLGQWPW